MFFQVMTRKFQDYLFFLFTFHQLHRMYTSRKRSGKTKFAGLYHFAMENSNFQYAFHLCSFKFLQILVPYINMMALSIFNVMHLVKL